MSVISVGLMGLLAVLAAVQLKAFCSEYAVYAALAAGLIIAFYTVGRLETVTAAVEQFMDALPVDAVYVTTLLKMIGITYTVQLCAGLCKDAGYSSIAGQIETFGKLTVLSLGLPAVLSLLDTVRAFLYEGL